MSSQAEQAAVQASSDMVAFNCAAIAALALLSHDTLLTLPHEVRYIWVKNSKLGTVLYIFARYSMLLQHILSVIFQFLDTSPETCNVMLHFQDVVLFLSLLGTLGLLLARAYAVTHHKWLVLAVLAVIGCCAFLPGLPVSILDRCHITSAPSDTVIILYEITSIAIIIFSTIVVAVTLASTLGSWRIYRRSTWNGLSLTRLLAQQSLMTFGFVLTITDANSILLLSSRPTIRLVFAPVQNSLSVIFICRFHLDLKRRHAHPNINSTSRGLPTISIGSFLATTQRMHDAVMVEFGDSHADVPVDTDTSQVAVVPVDPDIPVRENDIALMEILSQPQGAEVIVHA